MCSVQCEFEGEVQLHQRGIASRHCLDGEAFVWPCQGFFNPSHHQWAGHSYQGEPSPLPSLYTNQRRHLGGSRCCLVCCLGKKKGKSGLKHDCLEWMSGWPLLKLWLKGQATTRRKLEGETQCQYFF